MASQFVFTRNDQTAKNVLKVMKQCQIKLYNYCALYMLSFLLVQKPHYCERTSFLPWWLVASPLVPPGHWQLWYWPCMISNSCTILVYIYGRKSRQTFMVHKINSSWQVSKSFWRWIKFWSSKFCIPCVSHTCGVWGVCFEYSNRKWPQDFTSHDMLCSFLFLHCITECC